MLLLIKVRKQITEKRRLKIKDYKKRLHHKAFSIFIRIFNYILLMETLIVYINIQFIFKLNLSVYIFNL